jgi:hypothetical protein
MNQQLTEKTLRKKYLTSAPKARKYLNELLNMLRAEEDPDIPRYRAEACILRIMLDYFRFVQELELEKRIEAIERKLEGIR